jgi:hypothetical protein
MVVPKISSWQRSPKSRIEKTLYFQWFCAVRAVGIAPAKWGFVGTETINQTKKRKDKL